MTVSKSKQNSKYYWSSITFHDKWVKIQTYNMWKSVQTHIVTLSSHSLCFIYFSHLLSTMCQASSSQSEQYFSHISTWLYFSFHSDLLLHILIGKSFQSTFSKAVPYPVFPSLPLFMSSKCNVFTVIMWSVFIRQESWISYLSLEDLEYKVP